MCFRKPDNGIVTTATCCKSILRSGREQNGLADAHRPLMRYQLFIAPAMIVRMLMNVDERLFFRCLGKRGACHSQERPPRIRRKRIRVFYSMAFALHHND
jgi:hypothetical protein